ncbi:MAG: hypothetical protein ACREQY_15495, partial [Candidatus Binatia bacterium]
ARSGSGAAHCAYHHGGLCQEWTEAFDEVMDTLGFPPPHDDDDPAFQDFWTNGPEIETLVATRELALAWGADTASGSPVCDASGQTQCFEEGSGTTYANRYSRERWQAAENPSAPSGYFVEDTSADCIHCSSPTSGAFLCGVCFLVVGRGQMPAYCSECLTAPEPPPSGGCPVEEAWP